MAMSSDEKLGELRQLAAKFRPQIEDVYNCSSQGIDESKLLSELLKLIDRLPPGFHLFCDPEFDPISVFCLTLFSFSNQDTIAWLKGKFNPILAQCRDCVLHFTQGRCKMLQHFAIQRKVPHEHVTKFNDIVSSWRAESIFPVIRGISINNNTDVQVTEHIKTALFECLCNPQVLRTNEGLKRTFDVVFKFLYDSKHTFLDLSGSQNGSIDRFTAGVVYCWFEGSVEEVAWSGGFLKKLYDDGFVFNSTNFTQDILEEIYIHFLYLQNVNNFHEALVSHFWSKLTPILNLFETTLIEEYFIVPKNIESLRQSIRSPIESIFKLWYNHFAHSYHDKPLDILLRALKVFLVKFEERFWTLIEPYTFHSILDILFDKNSFSNKLIRIQNNPILPNNAETLLAPVGSLTDLVSWTLPFYHSLSSSKRIQMVKKVSMPFLRIVSNHQVLKPIPKACLMNSSTSLLSAVLTITDEERSMLYKNDNFETMLYAKVDSRALLNNSMVLHVVIQSATNPNTLYPGIGDSVYSVSSSAMKVLSNCIDYDILILCQATYKLYCGRKTNEVRVTNILLSQVVQHLELRRFHDGPTLAVQLLASLRNVNGLLTFKSKDPVVSDHNKLIQSYIDLLKKLLAKLTDILPNQLVKVLSDEYASAGFWSCIFTSDTELYQAATNILYETFDVEGRLEGIQEMFNCSLKNSVNSINIVLSQLIKNEFYEPCPRALRVLMDVINGLTDPVNGIIANYKTLRSSDTDTALRNFWSYSWDFLNMIYKATLRWATKYPYAELENFTKDTLDTSILLIDSYREFSEILITEHSTTMGTDLFQNILVAFKNMLYWLRLSDEYLLASCVQLIVRAADLANEKGLLFDDELVAMMVRYAVKARKYSNKLTVQQSAELLSRAKGINESLTDAIAAEADQYHKEKQNLSVSNEQNSQTAMTVKSEPVGFRTSAPESRADFLQRKAMSSSIVGRPKAQQKITSFGTFKPGMTARPPAPSQKPMSKLELARRQLLADRKVHPPTSNVFNPRTVKPPVQRILDHSSDESDDDIDNAKELFSISKPKERSTPILLDINGKPVQKVSKAQKKKNEEENMRKRLNVDLNPFYSKVLKWNYTNTGEYPSDSHTVNYEDIKDEFNSAQEYQKIMEPLLLLECWQGLCAARDREDHKPFSVIVGNRTAVSDFYEVYASITKKMAQESGISESDLIVLSFFADGRPLNRISADDFKTSEHTCLAKVCGLKNSKGENMDLTLRIDRSHKFSKFLTLRAEIFAVKVMQMTTVEREYSSLEGLPFYDLVGQILKGKPTPTEKHDDAEIEHVKRNYKLNHSQAEAIIGTVSTEGFSLIQGPPGTGKTKTILGIVGYFLSTRNALPAGVIRQPVDSLTSSTEQLLQKQKVLICAPSNAAVDELVLRLRDGVFDRSGILFRPKLVRVGRSDAVNAAIRDLTLEELVDKKLQGKSYEFTNDPDLDKNLHGAIAERKKLRQKLDIEDGSPTSSLSTEDISKIQLSVRELSKKINELGKQRDEIRERNSVNYRSRELDRRKAQARILAESDIICSTLSGSAHDILASLGVKFDTVIIDEACQCTELSSIIPLRYGGKRCIMVGDPNQLPPTVLSGAASNYKYNQSLFVRMEKNCSPHLLNVQYRMHPAISRFPSLEFYDGKLKDGPEMDVLNKRPWHETLPLSPYRFFDIVTGKQEQNRKTMSFVNSEECRVAIQLIEFLLAKYDKKVDFTGKIGVISPYREQMMKMKREFKSYFGNTIMRSVDFNTIDGFQGQEKEIIIISCVRADDSKSGVGFLRDFRRMNVALTRAKTSMWILGNHASLFNNRLWRNLITDAKERGCLELACSGFLDSHNSKAANILKRFEGSHDHIDSDDYDPASAVSLERHYVEKRRGKRKHPRNQNSQLKSEASTKDSNNAKNLSTDKAGHSQPEKRRKYDNQNNESANIKFNKGLVKGTKKKSSIFGGHSLATDVSPVETVANQRVLDDENTSKHVSLPDNLHGGVNLSNTGSSGKAATTPVIFESRRAHIKSSDLPKTRTNSENSKTNSNDAFSSNTGHLNPNSDGSTSAHNTTHIRDIDSENDEYDPSISPVPYIKNNSGDHKGSTGEMGESKRLEGEHEKHGDVSNSQSIQRQEHNHKRHQQLPATAHGGGPVPRLDARPPPRSGSSNPFIPKRKLPPYIHPKK